MDRAEAQDVMSATWRRSGYRATTIQSWLAKQPRSHAHFKPTSASSMNLLKRWLATLAEQQISLSTDRSARELEAASSAYLAIAG